MLHTTLLLVSTVVCSEAFLSRFLMDLSPSNCTKSEFRCTNSLCVPTKARCDGTNDCGDFSDEQDCGECLIIMNQLYFSRFCIEIFPDFILCQEPHFFRCKNHRCIAHSFVCDKENDCEDYSDEADCDYFKVSYNPQSHFHNKILITVICTVVL